MALFPHEDPTQPAVGDPDRGRLLRSLSHDLRSPLAGLQALLDLMESGADGSLTVAQRDRLRRIRMSADALSDVANQIAELALLESGRLSLAPATVDLCQVARLAGEDMWPSARSSAVQLSLKLPADIPRVRADPARLRQILGATLRCALRRAEGSTLELIAAERGTMIEVSLRETSRTIPVEALPPEYPDESGSHGVSDSQTGVGLSLARGLVELHGGRLSVNGGSTGVLVSFTLPSDLAGPRPKGERIREAHPSA